MSSETVRRLTQSRRDDRSGFRWDAMRVCSICGTLVAADDLHQEWHEAVAAAVLGGEWRTGRPLDPSPSSPPFDLPPSAPLSIAERLAAYVSKDV